MFTNLFILIITIAKKIAIRTNVSNSTSNIIIIKSFIERSKRFIKEIIKLRSAKNAKNAKNDYKNRFYNKVKRDFTIIEYIIIKSL